MRNIILLASAAAMAATIPSLADAQGNGRGGGRGGHGGGHHAAQGHGNGGGNGGGHQARGNRGGGHGGGHQMRVSRGGGHDGHARQERRAERQMMRQERRAERRAEREMRRVERQAQRQPRNIERDIRRQQRQVRREDRHIERQVRREARQVERQQRRDIRSARIEQRRMLEPQHRVEDRGYTDRYAYWREGRPLPVAAYSGRSCPPGLARQNAFCLPPGQLRRAQLIGQQVPYASWDYNVPDRYRYRFEDNNEHYYRYGDDGYVYELDRSSNLVSSVIPLYATQMLVGEPMPLGYEVYNLPMQYRDDYQDSDEHLYRYDDNAIYRVDGESGIVQSIVALLTGGSGGLGGLGVGQLLPDGYDAYNVPMQYRDQYADSDEHLYRYADGNIYQVDPQTQLIEQVISLLT